MPRLRLLPGEKQVVRLRPHPFSWGSRYLVAALPALWGLALFVLFRTDWWQRAEGGSWYQFWTFLYGNASAGYVYAIAGLAILGAIVAVAGIKWRVFFAYVGIGTVAVGLTAWGWHDQAATVLPLMLWLSSIPGVLATEADRISHRYVLTNLRILFRGGWFVRKERQIRYEAITDLDGQQGPVGRLLGYGTIIPITQSGFGLGADSSQAMVGAGLGAGAGAKNAKAGGLIGVAAGGGREVKVGRARSHHQLQGVRPFGKVQHQMEALIQNATATPYLQQQVELQRQMVRALGRQPMQPPMAQSMAASDDGDFIL